MKTNKHILSIFALIICCLLAGCKKKEFSISGHFTNADMPVPLQLTFYTSDTKKGWFTEQNITVMGGEFTLKAPISRPTVVFISGMGNAATIAFYASRGDKIEIKGDFKKPWLWEISGNDINKEWSQWRKQNEKDLESNDHSAINKSVETYIKANPSSTLSLLLLMTEYDPQLANSDLYGLWKLLKPKAKDKEIYNALGIYEEEMKPKSNTLLKEANFYSHGDSIYHFKASDNSNSTIIYLWQDAPTRENVISTIRKSIKSKQADKQPMILDINMQADTLGWSTTIRNDSIRNIRHLWAPESYQQSSLRHLTIPSLPYIIIIDKNGRQIYRGIDMNEAVKKI